MRTILLVQGSPRLILRNKQSMSFYMLFSPPLSVFIVLLSRARLRVTGVVQPFLDALQLYTGMKFFMVGGIPPADRDVEGKFDMVA